MDDPLEANGCWMLSYNHFYLFQEWWIFTCFQLQLWQRQFHFPWMASFSYSSLSDYSDHESVTIRRVSDLVRSEISDKTFFRWVKSKGIIWTVFSPIRSRDLHLRFFHIFFYPCHISFVKKNMFNGIFLVCYLIDSYSVYEKYPLNFLLIIFKTSA